MSPNPTITSPKWQILTMQKKQLGWTFSAEHFTDAQNNICIKISWILLLSFYGVRCWVVEDTNEDSFFNANDFESFERKQRKRLGSTKIVEFLSIIYYSDRSFAPLTLNYGNNFFCISHKVKLLKFDLYNSNRASIWHKTETFSHDYL